VTARRRHEPPSRQPRPVLVASILIAPEPFVAGRWDVHCPRAADCREFDTIEAARAHADAIATRQGLLVEERS
jgi:hypothetical protein